MCGGARLNESQTYQLIDQDNSRLNVKTINLDVKTISCRYDFNIISLTTNDLSKLIIIKQFHGYDVYDCSKNE